MSGIAVAGTARPRAVCGSALVCGPAVQWQEESGANEMVPYFAAFVVCKRFSSRVSALMCCHYPKFLSFFFRCIFPPVRFSHPVKTSTNFGSCILDFPPKENRNVVRSQASQIFGLRRVNGEIQHILGLLMEIQCGLGCGRVSLLGPFIHILHMNMHWVTVTEYVIDTSHSSYSYDSQ